MISARYIYMSIRNSLGEGGSLEGGFFFRTKSFPEEADVKIKDAGKKLTSTMRHCIGAVQGNGRSMH